MKRMCGQALGFRSGTHYQADARLHRMTGSVNGPAVLCMVLGIPVELMSKHLDVWIWWSPHEGSRLDVRIWYPGIGCTH